MTRKPKVLFFSTGDATRSQMAEGFLRAVAGDKLIGISTAVQSPDRSPIRQKVNELTTERVPGLTTNMV